ncbi:MAG: hypothetical protein Kow00105_19150 [Phycisphaeraceae bacterium]
MSLAINIADAIVAELNAAPLGTFDLTFTALRRVLPVFDLAEMADLHVSVVPRAVEIAGATRSASQYDVQIDIGVQQKLASDGGNLDQQVPALCGLVDQIADYLRRRVLQASPQAVWVRTANDPIYAPEHLSQLRQFTSVLTLTYRVMR